MARIKKTIAGDTPPGRQSSRRLSTDRESPGSAKVPVALTPDPDPSADRSTRRIIMNIFGKRFELTHYTEVRVLTNGPAKVIEMRRQTQHKRGA